MIGHRNRTVRVLPVLASLLAAGIVALLVLEAGAQRRPFSTHEPPGNMVSVGSHRLHLYCEGTGAPPVLLDAGSGLAYSNWQAVQSELASRTRVCSYDRTGLGWSESGPLPPSANQATTELHALMRASGISGPWIVVGHSLGGLYAQQLLNRYPEVVAGIVLVDAPHPDLYSRPALIKSLGMDPNPLESLSPFLTYLGVHRRRLPDVPESDPSWVSRQLHATSKHLMRSAKEWWSIPLSATQVLDSAADWGDQPLVVLQAGNPTWPEAWIGSEEFDVEEWVTALQEDLARRSTRGQHIQLDGIGHGIPWEAPGVIVAVVDSLLGEAG